MSSFEQAYYEADSFWAGDALTDPGNRARVELTATIVPDDVQSVLDAGCGNGVFGKALLAVRADIALIGMDRSAAALKYVPFESVQGSLDDMPFDDGSFDCVTCLQVIEHLPLGVYETALRELARVARRYVIIGVPYQEDLERETTVCPACRTRFNIDLHLRSYNDEMIAQLFAQHGGRLVRLEFPARRRRLKYVNDVIASMNRAREPEVFRSPICPICGYSEGDLPTQAELGGVAPAPRRTGIRAAIKALAKPIAKIWPKEQVMGYWAICLYEFPTPAGAASRDSEGAGP